MGVSCLCESVKEWIVRQVREGVEGEGGVSSVKMNEHCRRKIWIHEKMICCRARHRTASTISAQAQRCDSTRGMRIPPTIQATATWRGKLLDDAEIVERLSYARSHAAQGRQIPGWRYCLSMAEKQGPACKALHQGLAIPLHKHRTRLIGLDVGAMGPLT